MEEVRTLARRRDQYLLLRIEEMRDELRVVLHDLGPEVDDLALIVFGLATGELFESPREALRLERGMVEEIGPHEAADLPVRLRITHASFPFDERLHEIDGLAIQGGVVR